MKVVVKSLMVTMEQEMPGGHTLPVITVRMGDSRRSKALEVNAENWSSKVSISFPLIKEEN